MSRPHDKKSRNSAFPSSLPQESPKLNPKDSMGSEDSNISYGLIFFVFSWISLETHDVDNDKPYDQYKFSLKGFEDRTSVGSYGEGDSKFIPGMISDEKYLNSYRPRRFWRIGSQSNFYAIVS